jgi:hypothetical protein
VNHKRRKQFLRVAVAASLNVCACAQHGRLRSVHALQQCFELIEFPAVERAYGGLDW